MHSLIETKDYARASLDSDLAELVAAMLKQAYGPASSHLSSRPDGETVDQSARRINRLGRRRTAYPLDMSLGELHGAGLIIQPIFKKYHQPPVDRYTYSTGTIVQLLAAGQSVLLLGEPGSGKSLAIYEIAVACREIGLIPIPLRAVEVEELAGQSMWKDQEASPGRNLVFLIDGLDEAIDQSGTEIRFAAELRSLIYNVPHVERYS